LNAFLLEFYELNLSENDFPRANFKAFTEMMFEVEAFGVVTSCSVVKTHVSEVHVAS
jgi:hypothetical protein